MDEGSSDEIFRKRDFRKKKEKKRSHKSSKEKEECTKESFKKMKQEIDELRKKEQEREKELEILRKKIEIRPELSEQIPEVEYSLGFDKSEYLNKGFIESAKWLKSEVAKNMQDKMSSEEEKSRFETMMISKKASTHMGMRTCARYNRGEECNLGKWHATHKTENPWSCKDARQIITQSHHHQSTSNHHQSLSTESFTKRNEIRLHACTLCLEALMTINGHSVLNCPWILKKNWNNE
jgi:hypothetical protein